MVTSFVNRVVAKKSCQKNSDLLKCDLVSWVVLVKSLQETRTCKAAAGSTNLYSRMNKGFLSKKRIHVEM